MTFTLILCRRSSVNRHFISGQIKLIINKQTVQYSTKKHKSYKIKACIPKRILVIYYEKLTLSVITSKCLDGTMSTQFPSSRFCSSQEHGFLNKCIQE